VKLLKKLKSLLLRTESSPHANKVDNATTSSHLDLYWTKEMADILETWGEKNAWHEIDYLLAPCRGRVLDIACGTGRNIKQLETFQDLEVHGCDISDYLIRQAAEKGIRSERLVVCDAVNMPYKNEYFDYTFSIGSLEHFRDDNCEAFLREAARVTRQGSFHQIPTSRDGIDHGWITTFQSYYNNSVEW